VGRLIYYGGKSSTGHKMFDAVWQAGGYGLGHATGIVETNSPITSISIVNGNTASNLFQSGSVFYLYGSTT
jgi:hypothetical protein